MITSSESVATNGSSSQVVGENDKKPDIGSIEEAELSLRESGSINYEEARALLRRYEYQNGSIEAAFYVFEGIDVSSITTKSTVSNFFYWNCGMLHCELFVRPSCSVQHMSLDNKTGMDPPGIRVRPVNGLVATNYFAPGYFLWAVLIANLACVGYEEKKYVYGCL